MGNQEQTYGVKEMVFISLSSNVWQQVLPIREEYWTILLDVQDDWPLDCEWKGQADTAWHKASSIQKQAFTINHIISINSQAWPKSSDIQKHLSGRISQGSEFYQVLLLFLEMYKVWVTQACWINPLLHIYNLVFILIPTVFFFR